MTEPQDEFLATTRPFLELERDESGQVVIEWTLILATVVIPMGLMGSGLVNMLYFYFYRIAGTIALPFP